MRRSGNGWASEREAGEPSMRLNDPHAVALAFIAATAVRSTPSTDRPGDLPADGQHQQDCRAAVQAEPMLAWTTAVDELPNGQRRAAVDGAETSDVHLPRGTRTGGRMGLMTFPPGRLWRRSAAGGSRYPELHPRRPASCRPCSSTRPSRAPDPAASLRRLGQPPGVRQLHAAAERARERRRARDRRAAQLQREQPQQLRRQPGRARLHLRDEHGGGDTRSAGPDRHRRRGGRQLLAKGIKTAAWASAPTRSWYGPQIDGNQRSQARVAPPGPAPTAPTRSAAPATAATRRPRCATCATFRPTPTRAGRRAGDHRP